MVITAAYTGMRWGELAGLSRDNLHLTTGIVHVHPERRTRSRTGSGWYGGSRSSPTSTRGNGHRLRRRRSSTPCVRGRSRSCSPRPGGTRRSFGCSWSTSPIPGTAGPGCLDHFGEIPQQILHEDNSIVHVSEYDGQPHRRPLTYDEVQALFDAADGLVEEIRARGRKGALTVMRDAALLKTIYAFGLRRNEACRLDLVDVRHNPKAREFGRFGALFVRFGKASRGSPPKRRTVLTVPEMDWIVPVLQQWVDEIRPRLSPGGHPALWVTERRGRVSKRSLNEAEADRWASPRAGRRPFGRGRAVP
jgi:integrase